MCEAKSHWPFEINAIVLLPDHSHAIWSLPAGDTKYPKRWGWSKKEFTKRYLACGGHEQSMTLSKQKQRRRGVWQRRDWEHTIEDIEDDAAHFDYIHWNPVKYGDATCPSDWTDSSFHRWVVQGVYDKNWGCGYREPPKIDSERNNGE